MVWAQAFPFVALLLYDDEGATSKETLATALIGSACLWLLLNIAFFCTIDISYLGTFFTRTTGPQYTVNRYNETTEDSLKFDAVFTTRSSFTRSINEDVKGWVASNIARWKEGGEPWFKIEMIPDDLLPDEHAEPAPTNNDNEQQIVPMTSSVNR